MLRPLQEEVCVFAEGCGLGAPWHWRRGLGSLLAPVGSHRVCTEVWRVQSLVLGPDLFKTANLLTALLCKTNITGLTSPFGERHKPEPRLGAPACVIPRCISCPALCNPAPTPMHTVLLSVPRMCKAFVLPSRVTPFVNSHYPSRPSLHPRSLIALRSSVLPVTYQSISLFKPWSQW